MPMIERLRNLQLNMFQSIAISGIILSIASQLGLLIMDKQVDKFWLVYAIWISVFTLSSFIKMNDDHSHDHAHDHDHDHF